MPQTASWAYAGDLLDRLRREHPAISWDVDFWQRMAAAIESPLGQIDLRQVLLYLRPEMILESADEVMKEMNQ